MPPRNRWGHSLTPVDVVCGECGAAAGYVGGDVVYPSRPDLHAKRFYLCACGARVGCHPGTAEPLGSPAGAATRAARGRAHAVFDPLIAEVAARDPKGSPRKRGYAWLARQLGIRPDQCHIGMMDVETADRVVAICKPHLERMRRKS